MSKQVVIYTRYSSEMQREDSCEDQKREVLSGLKRFGIDTRDAIFIEDKAESGTRSDRPGFLQLEAMIKRRRVAILAVDDQSRLSRSDTACSFITDLVFSGGRFISTGEGIDTNQPGWELRVKITEVHNSSTIRELAHRVHRGQKGRVLDDGAVGDHPFGYESYYLDLNWAEASRRGPKPKKGVQIFEDEARWVREVFDWFVNQKMSIGGIARELTKREVDKGRKSKKPGWHHSQVRRMLANPKYIGRWTWGATTTIRNSQGKTKQKPVPVEDQVVRDRPVLRILDQQTWDKAQDRLRELEEIYGKKPDQLPRGPRIHHTELYPGSLLGGLIECSVCGSRINIRGGQTRPSMGCPSHSKGLCEMATSVPIPKAEERLLELVGQILASWPSWMETTIAAMRKAITEAADQLPQSIQRDQEKFAQLEREVANLVRHLAGCSVKSTSVLVQIDTSDREIKLLRERIENARQAHKATVAFPDDSWIKAQFADLGSLLKGDTRQTALLLRRLFHRVRAEGIIAPGKIRGFARLHVQIRPLSLLKETLGGRLPESVMELVSSDSTEELIEFDLDLGEPTRRDILGPKVVEMRKNGMTWEAIGRSTGLGTGNASNLWKRWTDAHPGEASASA